MPHNDTIPMFTVPVSWSARDLDEFEAGVKATHASYLIIKSDVSEVEASELPEPKSVPVFVHPPEISDDQLEAIHSAVVSLYGGVNGGPIAVRRQSARSAALQAWLDSVGIDADTPGHGISLHFVSRPQGFALVEIIKAESEKAA